MPELPEVETVRRGLAPHLEGARITKVLLHRPNLRFAFPDKFAARLTGNTITNIARRAKYLQFSLDSGETILAHLGMTGNFTVVDAPGGGLPTPAKHDHVQIAVKHPDRDPAVLIYSDPRRFGFMDIYRDPAACAFINDLGPEPLGNELTALYLATRFAGRKTPIKSALLNQRIIAGLGNIYVCEALWRAGISPQTKTAQLVGVNSQPVPALEQLVRHIRDVLSEAIAAGGSTLKDFHNAEGKAGYFQHAFDVYDREGEPCHTKGCNTMVSRIVQSGRSSFFCPRCQPEIG